MRILMLSAASSVHTLRWATAFAERGHAVLLLSLHAPAPGYPIGVEHRLLPHMGGMGYVLNGSAVRRVIREWEPDVVNAHYATGYGTLARAARNGPVVLNVWGSDVFDFPRKSAVHRWWVRRNLLAATRLISTSEVMADTTHALVPERPRPAVVPFGVDDMAFSPRQRSGRSGAPIVVGTVKALTPTYGIDTLIKAFALVLTRPGLGDVRLRIVGSGPEGTTLRALAAEAGVHDRVDFIGAVPHERVPDELRKMDVFCALSREESFGVAVIEASACGLPVVVSDVGGLPEVVRDGVTGRVVPRNDPAAAAEALAHLIASTELRHQWGSAGRAHVQAAYAWPRCIDRMEAVLNGAINKPRRA